MYKIYTKRDYDDGSVYHALWCACYSIFNKFMVMKDKDKTADLYFS